MSFDFSPTLAAGSGQGPRSESAAGQVAIVGCGPTGCYTASALLRLDPRVRITVFDARPTPFGLVRFGVAPDHQGMKNVTRQFDRLFASENVDFMGNIRIGTDLPLSALQDSFDLVVIATGLSEDRPLAAPVDPSAHVYGAGQLLRMLNSDPDSALRSTGAVTPLGSEVLVIGTGNVAMDVARLLCKATHDFHGSDVDDDALDALGTSTLRRLTLLSRGPRDRVRWDPSMFAELCALPRVSVYLDGQIEHRSLKSDGSGVVAPDIRVDVRFNQLPVAVEADGERTVVRTRSTDITAAADAGRAPSEHTYAVDSVITAMGFVAPSGDDVALTGERVIHVGGCASGTLGNLAENRALAKHAAQDIVARLQGNVVARPGGSAIRDMCPTATTFEDWASVDRAETSRAKPNRLRTKFTSWSAISDVIAEHRRNSNSHSGTRAD